VEVDGAGDSRQHEVTDLDLGRVDGGHSTVEPAATRVAMSSNIPCVTG
jgi:hypothetical protein